MCPDSCFTLPLMLFAFLCLNRFQDLSDTKDDTIPLLQYCAASTLQSKHRGAVTDIEWLPPAFVVRPRAGWQGRPLTLESWQSWQLPFKSCIILQDRNGLKLQDQTWRPLFTCLRMFRWITTPTNDCIDLHHLAWRTRLWLSLCLGDRYRRSCKEPAQNVCPGSQLLLGLVGLTDTFHFCLIVMEQLLLCCTMSAFPSYSNFSVFVFFWEI